MTDTQNPTVGLSPAEIDHFIQRGFVRINRAFPEDIAEEARAILWRDMGLDASDPANWTRPVIRLGHYGQPPFRQAANTPLLHRAFDQLAGPDCWIPPMALGTFPVRFPSSEDPGDTGWHIDVSFGTEHPDFMEWRANVHSRGRALLMLFLFSDVGPDDAPTRLFAGSHRRVARLLEPAEEQGLTLRELVEGGFGGTLGLEEVLATGMAGTVYLCHPFLVHAASLHRGRAPRFLAQPPLLWRGGPNEESEVGRGYPVKEAVRQALMR